MHTGFEGDIVISSVYYPTSKGYVGSVDCVSAIRVQVGSAVGIGGVDVDVLQKDFL